MLNAQHNCRKNDIEMTFKSDSTVQNQTKNVVCLTKKKTSHSFKKKKKHHTYFSPVFITDHRVGSVHFNIQFYLYVCTDVRYWRDGVPINLCNLTPHIYYGYIFFYPAAARYSQDDMA